MATTTAPAPAAAAAATAAPAPAAATPAAATPAAGNAVAPAAAAQQPGTSASLYCGNLASDVTEGTLFELFNSVGPVASIRVCRDAITRRSLGYAYINFHNVADADRALNALNYHKVHGKEIRLMWSQRDPALRKSGVGNIFIKNLDKDIDNKLLHDTFTTFGNILSCRVMTDEMGNSRGFGFVHFETAEAAQNAIEKLNGMLINGTEVYVGRHISKRERASKFEEMKKNFTNVYVKFLDASVTDEQVRELFGKYGTITSMMVARDANGASKGFGFVNFSKHEEAVKAVEELDGYELAGKKLFVGRAQKKTERQAELARRRQERYNKYQDVNLYIKNLDDDVKDDRLRQEFEPFGTITSAKVAVDDKGASRGFGFVCFAEPDQATKAIAAMNGKIVGTKPLYVALAMRKEVRRQFLENQHQQRMLLAQQQAMQAGMFGYYPAVPGMAPRGQFMPYPQMMQQRPRFLPQQGGAGAANAGAGPAARPGFPAMPGPYPAGVAGQRPPRQGRSGQPRFPGAAGPQMGMAGPHMAARPPMGAPNGNGKPRFRPIEEIPAPGVTEEELTADPNSAKQRLGNYIFAQATQRFQGEAPEFVGKITGMLLELDNATLLGLQNDAEDLATKIDEAANALRASA